MIECNLFFCCKKHKIRSHEYQAIAGFISLHNQYIIKLKINYDSDVFIPSTNTFLCETHGRKAYYDIEDGTYNLTSNFIDYLQQNKILLFKRAYDSKLYKEIKNIRPYGLNYNKLINSPIEKIVLRLTEKGFLSQKHLPHLLIDINDWSMINNTQFKMRAHAINVLFCTRLWDQTYTVSPVDELNETRIQTIYALRKAFHKRTIAGVSDSFLSRKMCKDLILPYNITNRKHYLDLVQKSSVCVTTTGLHNSIGWKFAEFVACGKAIVSEPILTSVPGSFCERKNYISFSTPEQLIESCDYLLSHPDERKALEDHNIHYYYHFLRPDMLIWNTIKQIIDT